MDRKSIVTQLAPAAIGPYTQAVRAGGLIFCSGQIALDPRSNDMVGEGDVREQTRRAMDNLCAVIEEAGSDTSQIVKTTIFLTDMAHFLDVNEVYRTYFNGMSTPARSTVAVSGLPKGALVEIEAVAIAPE